MESSFKLGVGCESQGRYLTTSPIRPERKLYLKIKCVRKKSHRRSWLLTPNALVTKTSYYVTIFTPFNNVTPSLKKSSEHLITLHRSKVYISNDRLSWRAQGDNRQGQRGPAGVLSTPCTSTWSDKHMRHALIIHFDKSLLEQLPPLDFKYMLAWRYFFHFGIFPQKRHFASLKTI